MFDCDFLKAIQANAAFGNGNRVKIFAMSAVERPLKLQHPAACVLAPYQNRIKTRLQQRLELLIERQADSPDC
jgi:hypothetical protein